MTESVGAAVDPALVRMVAELKQARHTAAQAKQRADDLAAQLRARLAENGTYDIGDFAVTVEPQVKFSEDIARTVLTAEQIAQCAVTRIDAAKAKDVLPPAVYRQCQAEHGVRKITVSAS